MARRFVTMDGNENFTSFDEFRDLWDRIATRPALQELCRRTIVVEQPVHRDRALLESTRNELSGWPGRPPLIIDESDGVIGDVPRGGDPIVLLADHQTTGGYPIIATVCAADLGRLAQRAAGETIRFYRVDRDEALARAGALRESLAIA